MEIVGSIQVEPPVRGTEQERVFGAGWSPSSDGHDIQPREDVTLATAVRSLRELIADDESERSYSGVVAAYDARTRELVTITVDDGKVSRRTVRRAPVRERSNVIDLATHRRWISRAIS